MARGPLRVATLPLHPLPLHPCAGCQVPRCLPRAPGDPQTRLLGPPGPVGIRPRGRAANARPTVRVGSLRWAVMGHPHSVPLWRLSVLPLPQVPVQADTPSPVAAEQGCGRRASSPGAQHGETCLGEMTELLGLARRSAVTVAVSSSLDFKSPTASQSLFRRLCACFHQKDFDLMHIALMAAIEDGKRSLALSHPIQDAYAWPALAAMQMAVANGEDDVVRQLLHLVRHMVGRSWGTAVFLLGRGGHAAEPLRLSPPLRLLRQCPTHPGHDCLPPPCRRECRTLSSSTPMPPSSSRRGSCAPRPSTSTPRSSSPGVAPPPSWPPSSPMSTSAAPSWRPGARGRRCCPTPSPPPASRSYACS